MHIRRWHNAYILAYNLSASFHHSSVPDAGVTKTGVETTFNKEQFTRGSDEKNVKHGCLDRIQLQANHCLRETDQLLFEEIKSSGGHVTFTSRSPWQEVAEVTTVRIIPMKRGNQYSAWWLAETHDCDLIVCVEARKTCQQPQHSNTSVLESVAAA